MSVMAKAGHWWDSVPDVVACRICGCPIQRTDSGTVADGMRAHIKMVHPS